METKQCSICGEFFPETMIVTVGYPKSDRGGSVQCRDCFDYDQEFITRYPLTAIFTEFYKTLLQNQVIASSFDILIQLDVLYKSFRSKLVNKEFDLQKAAPDRLAAWAGVVNFYQCCLAGGGSVYRRRQVTLTVSQPLAGGSSEWQKK